MKVIRILLIFKQGFREVQRLIHPKAVIPVKLGRNPVPDRVIESVWGFFAVYVMAFLVMLLALVATGLDIITAFSAVGSCINNLGPGLADVSATYESIPTQAKWILCVAMLLGRLEVFTLLVLFTPMLWRGMAFQHVNFREDWGARRKLIFLVEDKKAYAKLGDWYKAHLLTLEGEHMRDVAVRARMLWEESSSQTIYMPDPIVAKLNIFGTAKAFQIGDIKNSYTEVFGAFPTHSLSGTLLSEFIGGIADYAEDGAMALRIGHAYYKEIKLAGHTETSLLDAEVYDQDEIVKAKGFDDGTKWAKTLRELVRKGKVEPSLEKLLGWKEVKDLTPESIVLCYSFAYYLQSTPERLNSFANMIRRVQYDGAMPVPLELAKLYGFKTSKEFETDWTEFIKSQDFK